MKLSIYTAATIFFFAVASGATNAAGENNLRLSSQRRAQENSVYYEVKSMSDESYCLDVQGGNTQNFTPLQMYQCNGSASQKFTIDSSGRVRSQLSSSACVEMDPVYGVFLYSPCQDSWQVLENIYYDGKYHHILNVGDNKCLKAESILWLPQNGDKVIGTDCTPSEWSYPDSRALWKIV
jgi:Ricin-type beta-trefoil lectin domain